MDEVTTKPLAEQAQGTPHQGIPRRRANLSPSRTPTGAFFLALSPQGQAASNWACFAVPLPVLVLLFPLCTPPFSLLPLSPQGLPASNWGGKQLFLSSALPAGLTGGQLHPGGGGQRYRLHGLLCGLDCRCCEFRVLSENLKT